MFTTILIAAALFAAPENLLQNPSFAEGLYHWRTEIGVAHADLTDVDGAKCVSIHGDTVEGYPRVVQDFAPEPGALYDAEVLARDTGITGGYGAYMTLEFAGADGKRIHFEQSSPALPGEAWTPLIARCVVPEGAARGMICLVLRGSGTALFRSPTLALLEHAPPAQTPGEIHLKFGLPLKTPFLGFGFEDDGWAANQDNAAHGVTDEDLKLIASRVEWMSPAMVRMFFSYKDFNPSTDWKTFDFDTDNMRSHYRALDTYQKLGTPLNLTGVEWGIGAPWAQPEAMARAIGEIFSELITKRGYTCIKNWTLTNEPNTHFNREGGSFEIYKELHLLVAKEFAARGLNVQIIGSDDTNGGLPWFQHCVADPDYFSALGTIASHFYLQQGSLRAAKYHVLDRLDLLAGRKPFIIAEFGFQDARSGALTNPLMDEFDYALSAAAFACDTVALGTSGLTIWCLHESHYPGGIYMNYGLFHYKDKGWSPKPVYYAWANFTRNTRAGNAVQAPTDALPPALSAVRIGASIFFVNQSTVPVRFIVEGAPLSDVRVFDEGSIPGATADETTIRSAAEGRAIPIDANAFTVPPRAFGRAW